MFGQEDPVYLIWRKLSREYIYVVANVQIQLMYTVAENQLMYYRLAS